MMIDAGFTYGIDSSIMWGKDNEGAYWQALVDGVFVRMGKQNDNGTVNSHRRMSRNTFRKKFMEE